MELEKSLGLVKEKDKPKSNGEQLVEYIEVKDTPFTVARNDKDWYLLMGKYRLTEALKTKEEAMGAVNTQRWIRIMQVINIMIDDAKDQTRLNNTIEKQQKGL